MTEVDLNIISSELRKMQLPIPSASASYEQLHHWLAKYINELVNNDFSALVFLLYRLDISERKLKGELEKGADIAGTTIATMMIERQMEKIESRRKYRDTRDISEEERW